MSDPPPSPDSAADTGRGSTTGIPRWVKVFGIIALVVVLLVVVLLVVGGGTHGPSRHALSDGGLGGHPSLASGTGHSVYEP